MSDFGFTINDLDNSESITNKIGSGYNPDGAASLVTSASTSKEKYGNQTLTSRNLTDIMSGGALTRNPAAVIDSSSKFVQSSLHSVLATGAQAASNGSFKISNPDWQGPNSGEPETLEGNAAYLRTVAESLVGTGLAPGQTMNPLLESLNGRFPQDDKSKVGDSQGVVYTHNNISYRINGDTPSLGERAVALESILTKDEMDIYIERGTILKTRIAEPALIIGFGFDIPDNYSGFSFVQTKPYSTAGLIVDEKLISASKERAFISAALIECLLMLTDETKGISINGNFALSGSILSENDKNNPGSGIDKNNTNAISDHVFGRAFDVTTVGDYSNIGRSTLTYSSALAEFLQRLSLIPMPLLPDLVIIHPDVAKEWAVSEGYDSLNTRVTTEFPTLKHINFNYGNEHINNIHMSFSPQRGGIYIGSSGWKAAEKSGGSESPDSTTDYSEAATTAKEKATTLYKTTSTEFSKMELFTLLSGEGPFTDELAAIFVAISGREANSRPNAFNGACFTGTTKSWGGDVSIGMFQFNLISLINKTTNVSTGVPIYWDGSMVNQMMIPAHKLAYTGSAGVKDPENLLDPNAVAAKLVSLYDPVTKKSTAQATTDDKLWYPINQIWMLVQKFNSTMAKAVTSKINTSGGLNHWGGYNNSDGTPRSECGFIFKVKFQDAVDVYLSTGKDISILEQWVRDNLPNNNQLTKDYIEGWMDGDVYYDHPKDGSLLDLVNSKPIVYSQSSGQETGTGNTDVIPTFSKTQILEAANWLRINRMKEWLDGKGSWLNGNIGCDRFARILSEALGLFGTPVPTLISQAWPSEGGEGSYSVPTVIANYPSAAARYKALVVKTETFFGPDTDDGKNPPAGYVVFWTGGTDGLGHDGISIGGGEYVDQHNNSGAPSPRPILPIPLSPIKAFRNPWPGSEYVYAGASSVWS